MMPPKQPKISQKLVVRTSIGLLALAGLIFGFQYLHSQKGDIGDVGSVDSAGWITAVQQDPEGSSVVYFDAGGTMHSAPEHVAGTSEKTPIWREDGNRIYFSSDRAGGTYQILRWNLANGGVENRAPGKISRTMPEADPFNPDSILLLESGLGYRLDTKAGKATRVFPPVENSRGGNEGDAEGDGPKGRGSFDFGLGEQYRLVKAKWLSPTWLVGIQRNDYGESLIAQTTDLQNGTTIQPYVVILTGKHIAFDVHPETETIVCVVDGFRIEPNDPSASQFIKNNKIVPPFKNALIKGTLKNLTGGLAALMNNKAIMAASSLDKQAFGEVNLSPDGSQMAFTFAESDSNEVFKPLGLAVAPTDPSKGNIANLAPGEIFEPSWSPDGQTLAFSMRDGKGNRGIYTIPVTGGAPKLISAATGVFNAPRFSPQTKAAG